MNNETHTPGLPSIRPGMRVENRVREVQTPGHKRRHHFSVLVSPDGADVCTLATDAIAEARAAIVEAEGRA